MRDLAALQATVPFNQLSLLKEARIPAEADGQRLLSSTAIAIVFGTITSYLLQLLLASWRGKLQLVEQEHGPA